jgi:NAD(P)-dependent dehydrogenase (short-subunit alcohol dehydrogenase family)
MKTKCKDIAASVRAKFGFIDVLVNNAGERAAADAARYRSRLLPTGVALMDTNVTGMFLLTNAICRRWSRKNVGAIVNISSMWALTGGSCEVALFRPQKPPSSATQGSRKRGCAKRNSSQLHCSRLCAHRYDALL